MIFYFTIITTVMALTMLIIFISKYGHKKKEFEEINNPKMVGFKQTKLKLFK